LPAIDGTASLIPSGWLVRTRTAPILRSTGREFFETAIEFKADEGGDWVEKPSMICDQGRSFARGHMCASLDEIRISLS
jgi:hypothetical protein